MTRDIITSWLGCLVLVIAGIIGAATIIILCLLPFVLAYEVLSHLVLALK